MGRSTMANLGTPPTIKRKEVTAMKLTDLNLKELIKRAKKHDACEEALTFLQSCSSMEDVMKSKDAPEYAYWYANNVIKGRWVEFEPLILTDPHWTYMYACDVIKGRWVEAEPIILTDPYWAYLYARDVIQGRWAEAEPLILTEAEWTYVYARDVIQGRWAEAEPIILTDAEYTYLYGQ